MIYSPSSVKKFRRCKRSYYYGVVEGLEIRRPDIKLKRGSWFHELMEVKYSGADWRKAHRRLTKDFNNLFLEERESYGDLPDQVERMMNGYELHWRDDEENWEILHNEETFQVEFSGGDFLNFKPDLIIRDHAIKGAPLFIVDHKTTKSIPSADWRIEDLQSTIYYWALRELGMEIKGFIYNYIRTKDPTVPSINKDGSISKRRIDTDYYTMAKFLLEYFEETSVNKLPVKWKTQLHTLRLNNKFLKRSRYTPTPATLDRTIAEFSYTAQEMEIWSQMGEEQELDPWVRTMVPSCDWDCEFHDLCMVELLGGDGKFMRRQKYQPSTYTKERNLGRKN